MLDPACGSGHILVVAYDVLKAIYLERGYQARAIPRLILEKNLYGLDIDDRAAQLAGFALLMKARADDRRLLDDAPIAQRAVASGKQGAGSRRARRPTCRRSACSAERSRRCWIPSPMPRRSGR